jgi:hypothetical protein
MAPAPCASPRRRRVVVLNALDAPAAPSARIAARCRPAPVGLFHNQRWSHVWWGFALRAVEPEQVALASAGKLFLSWAGKPGRPCRRSQPPRPRGSIPSASQVPESRTGTGNPFRPQSRSQWIDAGGRASHRGTDLRHGSRYASVYRKASVPTASAITADSDALARETQAWGLAQVHIHRDSHGFGARKKGSTGRFFVGSLPDVPRPAAALPPRICSSA